ncbi:hypothetical protein BKA56DRAFT_630774 [Ilyonectria sp. MPI-CAGE-AT-0026]|nr:hypothetical protein BKA56DRAFT_630774 [Ilyonectria sp. MPI-CAGE-AT-0026]
MASLSPTSELDILHQAHSQPRKLKIIHVGAGASGLLAAYKAERMLVNYELICYDKFARKYDLEKYVQLGTRVLGAVWDADKGKWIVELDKDGNRIFDSCDVLLNGSGVVNKPKCVAAHSATWDPKISWTGKRVALIGAGSSSVQMLPYLAEGAYSFILYSKSVHVFARTPTWIVPPLGTDITKTNNEGISSPPPPKHQYDEAERQRFRTDPAYFLSYRKSLEATLASNFPFFLRDSPLSQWASAALRENMLQKLGPGSQEMKEKLIPSWSPGCRRLTPGENYLETMIEDHVHPIFEGVARFTPTGLVTAGGKEFEFDLIACATGFYVSYIPHFEITGVDGVTMRNEWSENPNIYLGITGPKFPNYFVINGPTGNWGQGCVLPSHEVQIGYALQCCKKIQDEDIKALEVKQLPTTEWNQHLDNWHAKYSVWAENCNSWYKANKPNGRVYIWPGSMLHLLKTMKTPRFEDFDITYRYNRWTFLGNGRTRLEELSEEGVDVDLAPFIRDTDKPWTVDP